MKILIAEDDPVSRRLLESYLARWGHEVVVTEDGAEAWRAFEAQHFPIVISDWVMPEVDGLVRSTVMTLRGLRPAEFPLTEPYRVKVVKATEQTNLSAYAADMPEEKFKKETLELINALYPNKKPPPGTLFKIVE